MPSRSGRRAAARDIEKLFRGAVERHGMIRPGDRVLAAVSGGADSVLMLALLLAHRARCPFSVHVAHVNHGLRGRESDADEAFVRRLAGRHGLPRTAGRVDLARRRGESSSVEQRARLARRAFLRKAAAEAGCGKIALGHTLDDQAETILMWLLRGSGRGGLSGMEPVTRDGIIRPLIEMRREEIREGLEQAGERFREDASNLDPRRTRNRIRLEILPALEEAFPAAAATLAATAGILADEDAYLDDRAARLLAAAERSPGPLAVARTPKALARRILRLAAARRSGGGLVLERDHVEAILAMARGAGGGAAVDLPGGYRAEKRDGGVVFEKRERKSPRKR